MEHQIITYMHNGMRINSIEAFGNIRSSVHQNCKSVYFVRVLGMGAGYQEEILKLDRTMLQSMQEGRLFYQRIKTLPGMHTVEEADYYADCYRKWQRNNRSSIETKTKGFGLPQILGRALYQTVEKYRRIKPEISETIERNFVVKLMHWFDAMMKEFLAESTQRVWDENANIKLAVHNVIKEQEYLFYYLFTLVGADVILFQNKADIALSSDLKELSSELVLGGYGDVSIPDFSRIYEENPSHSSMGEGMNANVFDKALNESKIRVVIPKRPQRKQTQGEPAPVLASQLQQPMQNPARTEKSFEQLALLSSSVVMINVHDNTGEPMGFGSGIMVGKKGYILTNYHVACHGNCYSVRIENDATIYQTREMIKYDYVHDLALIRIDRILNPLPIYQGKQKLVRGQKVVAIGSPLGLFNSVSDGIISGFRKFENVHMRNHVSPVCADMIQFTAPISDGSSGGAVLNLFGEVIGMTTAGFDDGQNINLAVGYEVIQPFIQGFL